MKNKRLEGCLITPGTRAWELLSSGDPKDLAKAKRLHAYCTKAAAAHYEFGEVTRLREIYKDVL